MIKVRMKESYKLKIKVLLERFNGKLKILYIDKYYRIYDVIEKLFNEEHSSNIL